MDDLRAAAQQALKALEYLSVTAEHRVDGRISDAAINALRAALAQEEQDQPDINWLRARPYIEQFIAWVGYDMTLTNERVRFEAREKVDVRQEQEELVTRRSALAALNRLSLHNGPGRLQEATKMLVHLPRREWQGLTLLERAQIMSDVMANDKKGIDLLICAFEDALRSKNHD